MATEYHIHGIELSPYSVKVRSYFRYKGIPHRWIPRSLDTEGEYQKFAKLPLVPLVVTPDGKGIQDSTPIIEYVEALNPEPSIHPADPVANFISVLLEEFGDEWGNKWMFHYRWAREDADSRRSAARQRHRNGSRPDGPSRIFRRLESADRSANRGLLPRRARHSRTASRDSYVPVRQSSSFRRLRNVGTALQCLDRPDARRDHQRDRA
jgi:hypothetical protein